MIPNKPGVPVRSILAAAVACASLVSSAGVRAQEPSPGGSDEVVRPAVGTTTANAAVRPSITLSRTWTGNVQEELRIDIRFTQSVTGFTIDDVDVFGGAEKDSFDGSGSRYSLYLTTDEDYEGPVIISILPNVAHNTRGEGNVKSSAPSPWTIGSQE